MIYFVTFQVPETNFSYLKVGYSKNSAARFKQLQLGMSLFELTFLGEIEGTLEDEGTLHRHLVTHHVKGEWFSFNKCTKQIVETLLLGDLRLLQSVPVNPSTTRQIGRRIVRSNGSKGFAKSASDSFCLNEFFEKEEGNKLTVTEIKNHLITNYVRPVPATKVAAYFGVKINNVKGTRLVYGLKTK